MFVKMWERCKYYYNHHYHFDRFVNFICFISFNLADSREEIYNKLSEEPPSPKAPAAKAPRSQPNSNNTEGIIALK